MQGKEEEREPESYQTQRIVISGATGSGKTWLCKHLIRQIRDGELSELIVISGTGSTKGWPETTPSRFFDSWDSDRVRRQMQRPGHKMFVVDDLLGEIRKDEPQLVQLFTKGRHHGASVILITQRLNYFSPTIRVNATKLYLTHTTAKKEIDLLWDEVATTKTRSRADWYEFVLESTDDHKVLVIEMVYSGKQPFSTLRPPATLHDHFVEPIYESDEEDHLHGRRTRELATLKKTLPASNRKWHFESAELPPAEKAKTRRPSARKRPPTRTF